MKTKQELVTDKLLTAIFGEKTQVVEIVEDMVFYQRESLEFIQTIELGNLMLKAKEYAVKTHDAVLSSSTYLDGSSCSVQYGENGDHATFSDLNELGEVGNVFEAVNWFLDGCPKRQNPWVL
jgi:hypothetical protein